MRAGLTLVSLIGGFAALVALVGSACSSGPAPHPYDGSALGSCTGQLAEPIPSSDCKAPPNSGLTACTGPTAYALCNGNTFNVCTCDLPSDYFPDGGTVDTGAGPPIKGLVPFDGGTVVPTCCIGKLVFELPASECPARCTGNRAYAVCVDGGWDDCTCEIPDGYGFSDLVCPGDF